MDKSMKKKTEILFDYPLTKLIKYNKNYIDRANNITKLKASLKRFGFQKVSVLIDENNVLIAGHGVVEAARKLGWKSLPEVKQTTGMSEEDKNAYRMADNLTQGGAVIKNNAADEIDELLKTFSKDELSELGFDKLLKSFKDFIKAVKSRP
jgi:ParB-like chromosome segregation protein Spo0J